MVAEEVQHPLCNTNNRHTYELWWSPFQTLQGTFMMHPPTHSLSIVYCIVLYMSNTLKIILNIPSSILCMQ